MKLFALADLHLSGSVDKPMDVFGPQWDNHHARIKEAWLDTVGENDLVLIPGDISWAMQLKDAVTDFETIAALPGVLNLAAATATSACRWSGVTTATASQPDFSKHSL